MDNKSFKGKNINPEGVIDSFTLLKYESHLLDRRVCILSAKHSQKIIVVIYILLHSAIGPYHLMSCEFHSQRPYSKFQVLIKKSLSNKNGGEMPSVKLCAILFTWKYPSLWIEPDIWFSLVRKYQSLNELGLPNLPRNEVSSKLLNTGSMTKNLWSYFLKFPAGSFLTVYSLCKSLIWRRMAQISN